MRRHFLSALILLACGLGSAQDAPAEWEYGTLHLGSDSASWFSPDEDVRRVAPADMVHALQEVNGQVSVTTDGLVAGILNVLGAYRWELVAVDGNVYIFKRPVEWRVEELPFLGE